MDWYYPVLTGALDGEAAKARLADGWDDVRDGGARASAASSDEPWVTASETAECAIAFAAIGDLATATDLLRWTRAHRLDADRHADRPAPTGPASCTPRPTCSPAASTRPTPPPR